MTVRDYYKIAAGHNNAGGLVTILPQPRTDKIEWGRRQTAGNSLTYVDGFGSTLLVFDAMKRSEFNTLMTTLGFSATVKSTLVTLRLRRNFDRAFANFNATVDYPELEQEGRGGWRSVTIPAHHISAITSTDEY